ncbi:MAG TPA: hypothetical protein VLE96_01905 [Chlamydiales bacterium]|nr:hypothetical protein [Chlamydiales bacterium]
MNVTNLWKPSTPVQSSETKPSEQVTKRAEPTAALATDLEAIGTITPPNNQGIIDRVKSVYNHAIENIQFYANSALEQVQLSAKGAVEKIQSLAGRVKAFTLSLVPDMHFEITKTKIEQVMLLGFAAYTGLGAKILAGGLIPTSFLQWTLASPFLAVSAVSIWYAGNLVDYESPETFEKVRKKAQKLPLADILNKHGWQNLFVHQILSPAQFQDAFRNLANSRTFKELFAIAKEATIELAAASSSSIGKKYEIPHLVEWIDTFHHETAHLELSEILAEYPLADLQALRALPPEELASFERAKALLDELTVEKEIVRKKLDNYIGQAATTVSKIDAAFGPNGSLGEELQILGDAFHKVQSEANDQHQKRIVEIGQELAELTTNYNKSRRTRPNIA